MLYNFSINRAANNYPSLFPVLQEKIFYTLHFSQRNGIEKEMACKENFNYSNFIFNRRGKKEDHNSFI